VLDATGYVDAIDDLLQGAEATDSSVRIALYRKAVAARRQALDKLDKAGVAELTLKEDQEGSATYFGLTAEQALAGKPIPLPDRVEGGFGSIKTAPPGGRIPLFYQYGYLTCLALNAIQPGWQTAWLTNSKSLSEMLDADVADGTHP
jgi:hypothetical protein